MPTTSMMIDAFEDWRKNPDQDGERFWMLVERFRADLVNQAFALLGSQPDAEDVAQETLVLAYLNLEKLRDPKRLGNWMRKINHNAALEHRLQRKRQLMVAEEAARGQDGTLSSHTKALTHQELVAQAIDSLPEDMRAVLVLRYWENLDYQGVAHRLGIPLGTVKSRLARADRLLEKKLRPVAGLEIDDNLVSHVFDYLDGGPQPRLGIRSGIPGRIPVTSPHPEHDSLGPDPEHDRSALVGGELLGEHRRKPEVEQV